MQRSIADVDRRIDEERPQMGRTVRAVEDIGLDPTGEEPVNGILGSALSGLSNARVVFPQNGRFRLTGHVTAAPAGPIEIVGNGSSFVMPPNEEFKSLTLVLEGGSRVSNIVIDQRATGALQELSIQSTSGVVRVDDVAVLGYAPAKPNVGPTGTDSKVDAMFSPIARTSDAVVRVSRFRAVGGTAAGTHDDPDKPPDALENRLGAPMGIWVGTSTEGKIQLIDISLEGWSNGIYGGRTTGIVEVAGGTFVNNFNAQVRVGGGAVVDGASMLLDDRQWSDNGPFSIGHQGVYAVRVDAKHGDTTTPVTLANLDIRALSMRNGASLIDFESVSGPGMIRNCRFEHHLDRPVVLGESPRGGGQTNIQLESSIVVGSSPTSTVVDVNGRPQSRVVGTCFQLPNVGANAVSGASVGPDVGFGSACAGGLSDPDAVGSGGNISAANVSALGSGAGFGSGIGKAALAAVGLVVLVGLVAVFGLPAFGFALGAVSTVITAYLFADE